MIGHTMTSYKVFTLVKISNEKYRLINGKTSREYEIAYRVPELYARRSGYKIESEYSGPAKPIFEALIPKLDFICNTFRPVEEDFESYQDSYEFSHGDNEYCSQFQTSKYKCKIGIKRYDGEFAQEGTIAFTFNNADLESVDLDLCCIPPDAQVALHSFKRAMKRILQHVFQQWPSPRGRFS